MAPDLNSVPPSPRPTTSLPQTTRSRRTSTHQPTSPSLNILPSNQSTVAQTNTTSPPLSHPTMSTVDNTGVGIGPGPLRHPRPLTAADLHLQLEKEQEAVVNRLTRELTMLRAAQNASVVSNTSSTSAGLPDGQDRDANHLLSGPSHPLPSTRERDGRVRGGHQRSSSSTSTRSNTANLGMSTGNATAGERTRAGMSRHDSSTNAMAQDMSRQNSTTGSIRDRRSGASSPAPASLSSSYQHGGEHFPAFYTGSHTRPVPQRDISSGSLAMMGGREERGDSVTSGRYEEAAFHRQELENVKRENEALKRRIRELESTLRVRRQSDAGRDEGRRRSESVSTTASVGGGVAITGQRGRERVGTIERAERDAGTEEEVVRLGESARSAGL